jgi:hypothetical protein
MTASSVCKARKPRKVIGAEQFVDLPHQRRFVMFHHNPPPSPPATGI